MLPKSNRLNLKKDFKRVASGRKLESKYLKLFIKEGENHPPAKSNLAPAGGARIGVAISSKTFKNATDRNRAKRLVFQAFQTIISGLPPTINIVALPKIGVLKVKSADVLSDLKNALKHEKNINLSN
ncbi:MAG: ribonuclease P protein component [Candidatus Daviesbacteria bacterium]|nr:ribonuclease P protein component [Candidatus Daviesbacteria bacterium]